tara:strand:- start:3589 stop:6168 length:2580 start_codon:yes stop_codon:yes gene_type:complete
MANNVDKSVYTAPQGLESLDDNEPDIQIEVEDPESMTIEAGGMTIILQPEPKGPDDFDANLAEFMDEGDLTELSGELLGDYDADEASRKEWLDTYVDGIELLGMKIEDRTEPWPGACSVFHPLLSEALVKFQAETMMETFPAAGPVKTLIIGKETKDKAEAAVRVKDDMNYQLTEAMPEYRPEQERLLWGLGLSGNAFKKVYYDPSLERQVAVYVPAEDIVVPYGVSSLQTASRVTHIMRKTENELRKLQVAGFYRDIDLGEPTHTIEEVEKKIAEKMGFNATMDDRFKVLEMHVDLDLPGYEDEDKEGEPTGIALPYVVTLERGTGEILAVRRNWNPDDKTKQKRQHFVHYGYIPAFGFYCFGLVHLIGAAAKSGTMLLRQLVDAGTLSNLPGGFKSRGLRIKGDDTPIAPAEFRDVDVPSGTIRDNILPLPYKEPSQVLMGLMNQIIQDGRSFANAADIQVSDMSGNSPVGTTLAILERTLKVMSAVQARIHYAMKQEFKLLAGIIRDYTPEEYSYEPEEGDRKAKQADYDMVEVIPVSDPNAATMSQKVVQYQAVMQMAQANPQIYDLPELNRQMLEVLGIKNIGKLIPSTDDQKPRDPVTENMAIINGKPVKAFEHQDHEAHIKVHMAFSQDPKLAELIGQNPQAQSIVAAGYAHLNEHIAFAYKRQLEDELGVELPKEDLPLPEEAEAEIARLTATAAQQLLQKSQAEAQQKQAEQQSQDPLVQMQQQELQIKAQEVQIKAQKAQADAQTDQERIKVERERIASTERIAQMNADDKKTIRGVELGFDAVKTEKELNAKQTLEGVKLGAQAIKGRAEHGHKQDQLLQQKEAASRQHELNFQQMVMNKKQEKEPKK